MSKKKIVFFSVNDWANSGYKMTEAVNRYSDKYEVEYFCVYPHQFKYYRPNVLVPDRDNIDNKILNKLSRSLQGCDIIHQKENSGFIKALQGVRFNPDTPEVHTFGGSKFRNYHEEVWKYSKQHIDKVTVTTPDLLIDGIGGTIIPFPIDTEKYKPAEKVSDRVVISHIVSAASRKGTHIVREAINKLKEDYDFDYIEAIGINHEASINIKKLSHIYIDQINGIGSYGNSAVEAMAVGCVVITQLRNGLDTVCNAWDVDSLTFQLKHALGDITWLNQTAIKSRAFCVETHSYPVVCKKLEKVYDEVLQ